METVVKNVRDLDPADRSALERVVGYQLRETQQVIVKVVNLDLGPTAPASPDGTGGAEVPDWWKIYDGLGDEPISLLGPRNQVEVDHPSFASLRRRLILHGSDRAFGMVGDVRSEHCRA
jgi:hypothetical protein